MVLHALVASLSTRSAVARKTASCFASFWVAAGDVMS